MIHRARWFPAQGDSPQSPRRAQSNASSCKPGKSRPPWTPWTRRAPRTPLGQHRPGTCRPARCSFVIPSGSEGSSRTTR